MSVKISGSLEVSGPCNDESLYLYDFQSEYATEVQREDCAKLASLLMRYIVSGTIE